MSARSIPLRPVREHDRAAAVRNENDGAVDRFQLVLDYSNALAAAQVPAAEQRHRAHLARRRELGCEQRLPVLGDVIAQAGNDQDRRRASAHAALLRLAGLVRRAGLRFGAKPFAASVSSASR